MYALRCNIKTLAILENRRIYARLMHKYESRQVAIIGARGYSGLDLARLILKHPVAQLAVCFANESAFSLEDYLPEAVAKTIAVKPLSEMPRLLRELHTVFLATPAEASLGLVPVLIEAGVNVIDLSGAFRLKKGGKVAYSKWYKFEHTQAELLDRAHFGLSPWANNETPSKAGPTLISNPGCYATSVLMAILPLLRSDLIEPSSLVIDSKSGTSGAGRKAAENLIFTEVDGECLPYRVGQHQHFPEIQEYAQVFGGQAIDPFFNTSLLPVRRGIISSIYARLKTGRGLADIRTALANAYEDYPLVKISALSELSAIGQAQAVSLKKVVGSARTHLAFEVVGEKLYMFSLLDNLLKGAASQAVENFNWLNGLPAGTGLTEIEGVL